jgi:hypothetical protein
MQLEVGKKYVCECGHTVEITSYEKGNRYPYKGLIFIRGTGMHITYAPNGHHVNSISSPYNLVRELDSPTPCSGQKEKGEEMINTSAPVATTVNVAKKVGGTAARLTGRMINYWLIEPAWKVTQRVLWSVRYVVLGSTVALGAYGWHNPDGAKSVLKSLVPKISIKVEAPEILK